jgi:YbbR domain-containing protein
MPKILRGPQAQGFFSQKDLWILRAVALFIAIILWMTVLGGKRIEITKTVGLDFQVPPGLIIANSVPKELTFRITGPRAFVKEFLDRNIVIPVDLKNAKIGDVEYFVKESSLDLPIGLKVVSVSQTQIPLKIDRIAIKRVPVSASFGSNLTDGFKIKNVTLKPSTVEIRGAQSRVQMIEALPTDSIVLLSGSLHQEVLSTLDLRDYAGLQIAESDKSILVSVELEGELSRKWVKNIPVDVRVKTGALNDSVEVKSLGVRVKPARVSLLIEGPEKILSELEPSTIQVWAEIPTLKGGAVSTKLVWKLAPELRVVKRSTDSVEVLVPSILSK